MGGWADPPLGFGRTESVWDSRVMEVSVSAEERREDLVEQAAREIQLRGLTVPAVLFLQASRPYRQLGSGAMVFFDPTLHSVFGGEVQVASEILADDVGIEQLIERLQDPDEEMAWDA